MKDFLKTSPEQEKDSRRNPIQTAQLLGYFT